MEKIWEFLWDDETRIICDRADAQWVCVVPKIIWEFWPYIDCTDTSIGFNVKYEDDDKIIFNIWSRYDYEYIKKDYDRIIFYKFAE